MTERTIKIKGLISGQVDMGTFGLVELELLAIEKEMEALRQPPVMVRSEQLPILKNIAEQYIYDAGMRNVEMQISYAGIKAIIEEWERMKLSRQ